MKSTTARWSHPFGDESERRRRPSPPPATPNQLLFIDVDTRMYAFTNAHQRSRFVSSSISGRRFLIARWALENWQAQLIKGHASV